jgi:hypothetical protein
VPSRDPFSVDTTDRRGRDFMVVESAGSDLADESISSWMACPVAMAAAVSNRPRPVGPTRVKK